MVEETTKIMRNDDKQSSKHGKLRLNRETLRRLTARELAFVQGGQKKQSETNDVCASNADICTVIPEPGGV